MFGTQGQFPEATWDVGETSSEFALPLPQGEVIVRIGFIRG